MVVASHLGGVRAVAAYALFDFYLLSGYLMTVIMHETYGYSAMGRVRYGLNRCLRLFPAYWVSIALSALLICLVGEQFSSGYHGALFFPNTLTDLFKNVFFIFPFLEYPRLTPPTWSLTVELFFYLLIGLGLSKNRRTVLLWLAVSIIYHVIVMSMRLDWKYQYFIIPAASLPFSLGAVIYHYKTELVKLVYFILGKSEAAMCFIIPATISANWFFGYLSGNLHGLFFYINLLLGFLMVVVLSERKSLPFISKAFDKRMGELSYPIYLIHYQAGLMVVYVLGMSGLTYSRPDMIILFISTPLMFVAAWFFAFALERPVEVLRTKIKKPKINWNIHEHEQSLPGQ